MICGATSGYNLDFDVRYLWMKQKEILGSHFANAYECMRANQLMAEGKVRPVLSEVMGFDGVPEAHQMLHENRHSGKIAIRVGATDDAEGKHEDGDGRDLGRGRRLTPGAPASSAQDRGSSDHSVSFQRRELCCITCWSSQT